MGSNNLSNIDTVAVSSSAQITSSFIMPMHQVDDITHTTVPNGINNLNPTSFPQYYDGLPQTLADTTVINLVTQPTSNTSSSFPITSSVALNIDSLGVNNNNDRIDTSTIPAETHEALTVLQQYVPFLMILLIKGLYDHHQGIINFIALMMVFIHGNNLVKKETAKGSKRNKLKLLLTEIYILLIIAAICVIFDQEKFHLKLILVQNELGHQLQSVWELLWYVAITDLMLKLITISIKIVFTLLPDVAIQFRKRGKLYLFIESCSQMYRSIATIQPWLQYLLESYNGNVKILGLILTVAYILFKAADLLNRLKFVKIAFVTLLKTTNIGATPNMEQLQTAEATCPICHDKYDSPIILFCRHIFCENCVSTWFDREQTCPLCRAKIVDDPAWRDGSTSFFLQLF